MGYKTVCNYEDVSLMLFRGGRDIFIAGAGQQVSFYKHLNAVPMVVKPLED
jgi:hypothetical protein